MSESDRNYISGTDIEIIRKKYVSCSPKIMIFDLDGTISTLREGWDTAMHDMMLGAVLGDRAAVESASVISGISERVNALIDHTAGIQTIMQMKELKDLITQMGFVEPEKIEEPRAYKEQFAQVLTKLIESRVKAYRNGTLDAEAITIFGAIPFLEEMSSLQVNMFLVSGTDLSEIEKEAELVGFKDLFDGGIFGSIGDIHHDPKKVTFRRIRESLGEDITPEQVVVFGDGPVEMREAKENGFIAVGLVSDEKRRKGINMKKRARLVAGGADYLIPDFSWALALLFNIFPDSDLIKELNATPTEG